MWERGTGAAECIAKRTTEEKLNSAHRRGEIGKAYRARPTGRCVSKSNAMYYWILLLFVSDEMQVNILFHGSQDSIYLTKH